MTENRIYTVKVPATTANIGSGFDTLGMALGLYNTVRFMPTGGKKIQDTEITAEGEGAEQIPSSFDNMIIRAMAETAKRVGKGISGGEMHLVNRIPFARGLGSSSAALAAGAFLANTLMGEPFCKKELLQITAEMEGHPDNAAPAVLGGFCMSLMRNGKVMAERVDIPAHWKAVVAIPDFELHTERARAVLPEDYSRTDAVHNIGTVSFLMAAFMLQKPEYLKLGLDDVIHVPYRLPLIPGAFDVITKAENAGAYGATISGSGPTMIAFASQDKAESVGCAMVEGFSLSRIASRYLVLDFDHNGIVAV